MNKIKLIDNILERANIQYFKSLQMGNFVLKRSMLFDKYSVARWDSLREFYKISNKDILEEEIDIKNEIEGIGEDAFDIESLRVELYKIGKEKNEKMIMPTVFQSYALSKAIMRTQKFKEIYTISEQQNLYKTWALFNLCEVEGYITDDIICSQDVDEKMKKILMGCPMSFLQKLYTVLESDKCEWMDLVEDVDEYGLLNYIEQLNIAKLNFLHTNFDMLARNYKYIKEIIEQLRFAKIEQIDELYCFLKKKKLRSRKSKDGEELFAINFDIQDMTGEKEEKASALYVLADTFEKQNLIYDIGELTLEKWETIILLLKHYGAFPRGAKIKKIIAKYLA